MDMNIQKYLAFVRTVEYGSFTKAAEKLSYSQSGISRMISDLEKEWNVSLLERGRTGVSLTSDGLKLLPFAQSVCNEYQKLQTQVNELNGLQSGLIRIGTFSSVATHWLPNIIKEFQKDYPNIDYELLLGDYTEIESWILEGRVDCGFLRLPTNPEFDTIFLEQDQLLVVLPENHPLADCKLFPVKALCDFPFMLLEKGAKAEISEIFEKNNIDTKYILQHGMIMQSCQW
jgi:DNA-binding transcriptional LysR family regulator